MKNVSKIKNTGQLRDILAKTIEDVISGNIEIDDANAVYKLSKNITDSLYSETKIRMFAHQIGDNLPRIGDLSIGSDET